MNANEIAFELDKVVPEQDVDLLVLVEAATMLRQQQDRIGVLEANHKIQLNINEKALQYIEQLEQGLRASINLNRVQAERNK
jgi:hypothetical protein